MADFGGDLETFRAEARAWLEENAPQSVRRAPDMTMEQMEAGYKPTGDAELWRQRMAAKGWGTPTWPTEYGGGGLSPAEARRAGEGVAKLARTNPTGGAR